MRPKQIHSQSVQETIGTISNGVWLVLVSGSLSTFPDSWIGHSRPFSWSLYSCLSPLWIFSYGVHSGSSVCQPCAWLSNIMCPQLSWQETEPKIDIICAIWNSLISVPTVICLFAHISSFSLSSWGCKWYLFSCCAFSEVLIWNWGDLTKTTCIITNLTWHYNPKI